ncbi:MAG TPA: glycosyltransferase [Oculatellaceae cyanobacterium]
MLGTDSSVNLTPVSVQAPAFGVSEHGYIAGRLSVIIRAHQACNRELLRESLESLCASTYPDLEVIVATDTSDLSVQQRLQSVIDSIPWCQPAFAVLTAVDCTGISDTRSRLLNEGVKRSRGQFVAFLDYDDVVYPDGYRILVDELIVSGRGVAAGGTQVAEVTKGADGRFEVGAARPFVHDGRSKLDLFKGNFLPIHSFVINRFVVPKDSICTEESLKRLEDHCLLVKLALVTEFSFAKMNVPVCEYRVFDGVFSGDRSKFLDSKDPDIEAWRQSKEFIVNLVARSTATVNVAQLKDDILERVNIENERAKQQVRHEAQLEIDALKQRVNEAEQTNLALSYQIEKWQAANKNLGMQLDLQNTELSRRPYRIVRWLLSLMHKLTSR